jgi:hypothetical protein
MMNISEIRNLEIDNRIEEHYQFGGALCISIHEIKENYRGEVPNEYESHLLTARQSIEKQHSLWNSSIIKTLGKVNKNNLAITDFDKLDTSGKKLELSEFLGPHFDLQANKPIIRGQLDNETINSYFYYDTKELIENKVNLELIAQGFWRKYPDNLGGFIYALIEPPFNMKLGKEIRKRGEYVIDFIDFFFGNLKNITVYSWSVDCSRVFDAGKEWWGSHFWTIYNKEKNWYVSIIASTTD